MFTYTRGLIKLRGAAPTLEPEPHDLGVSIFSNFHFLTQKFCTLGEGEGLGNVSFPAGPHISCERPCVDPDIYVQFTCKQIQGTETKHRAYPFFHP